MIKKALLFITLLCASTMLPSHAMAAQIGSLSCSSGGSSGDLYDTNISCQYTGLKHIFSTAMCRFMTVINDVLSKIYCGMQQALVDIIKGAFTLYVGVFGAAMLLGLVELSAKEFLSRIIKLAIVSAFVTQSQWGIDVAFSFFITVATDGINWVMNAIPPAFSPDPANTACYDAAALGASGEMQALTRLDYMVCAAVNVATSSGKLVGFMLALGLAFWPIFLLIASWLWFNFKVMVSGVITFLLGIASIAFLIAMSPIFLSFLLFKSTYQFFETWLKFLISFTLQIIVVFACITLWMMITANFITFFDDLSTLIHPLQTVTSDSAKQTEINSWGICPFDYTMSATGPTVTCQSGFSPNLIIPPSMLISTEDNPNLTSCRNSSGGDDDCSKFIFYVVYHLVTLIIVCYAFEALLREAPKIAAMLAGPEYAPMIGQGFGVNRTGGVRVLGGEGGGQQASGGGGSGQKSQSFLANFFGGSNSGKPAAAASTSPATQEQRARMASLTTGK